MKTVWAPWRIEYILDNNKSSGCVFCNALGKDDALTLFKGKLSMVVMNKFPYINGHLLVAPVKHIAGLDELDRKEKADLLELVDRSISILKLVMKPDGFNVGLNLGKVAGAGIEEHLHFHIVPRWFGDTNALTVFADVRVIPEHIMATYNNLKPHFDNLAGL
ncbi:MAG: HIT domain-containing protein [Proteobacteria bacterium]|nr:HIT domain-containing protein [Pseudomonadota bacterium]